MSLFVLYRGFVLVNVWSSSMTLTFHSHAHVTQISSPSSTGSNLPPAPFQLINLNFVWLTDDWLCHPDEGRVLMSASSNHFAFTKAACYGCYVRPQCCLTVDRARGWWWGLKNRCISHMSKGNQTKQQLYCCVESSRERSWSE